MTDIVWMRQILKNPSKVKAYSNSSDSIKLCWERVQIPCEYEVYRATSKNGKYTLLTTTSDCDYQDYSVEVGRTYYYKVRTIYKEEGQSYYSAWSETLPAHSLIDVPQIEFKDSSEEYIIPLTWTKVKHADGYELYRSTSKNGNYQMVSSTKKTELIEKNLPLNKTYYYKVRAYKLVDNKKVYSAYSQVKSIPLNVDSIGELNLKIVSATSVLVDWNDFSEGTVYEVYEAVGNSGTFVYKGTGKHSRMIIDGLEYGMTYSYKVRKVVKQNGKNYYGPFCSVAKITTAKKPMSKLKASVTSKGLVNVSYGKVSGMHGYEIYRATSQNGKYTLAGTSKGTSFTDKKVAVGQTYYYKVRAYRNVGKNKVYTTDSNVVKVSMAVGAPAKAKVVKKNATTIAISWNKVKEANGYEVYQSTSQNGSYKKVGTTKGNSITNAKLKKGKTYYYKVRAYRQIGTKKTYSKYTKVVAVKL